ncbi:MAG: MerR family transcriptional regulator [Calditerrivibrio sp.]|nr:MerR family transcriptional regulator [Calditerrivibrio sp.]
MLKTSQLSDNKVYYKIGEVCQLTGLKPSVIRFWEKEFRQLKPVRVSSNQRLYTQNHINIINKIKHLLYEEKLTIEGAKKKLRISDQNEKIDNIKKELIDILNILRGD